MAAAAIPCCCRAPLFGAIAKLDGDEGARKLLKGAAAGQVIEVEVSGMAAMLDVDTPQGLAEARRALEK